jgi:hypothetical protein
MGEITHQKGDLPHVGQKVEEYSAWESDGVGHGAISLSEARKEGNRTSGAMSGNKQKPRPQGRRGFQKGLVKANYCGGTRKSLPV